MISERLVAWSKPIACVCVVSKPMSTENRLIVVATTSTIQIKRRRRRSTWTLKWEALFLRRNSTKPTSHLGSTRCTNTFLVKDIGVMSKEQTNQPNLGHADHPAWEQATSWVLYCLASCVDDHMLDYIREVKTPKEETVGKSQKDIRNKHDRKKASTPSRVEQHSIEGYVYQQLHIEY